MFYLKACPKCRGDLHKDRDEFGPFMACLQCGHYLSDEELLRVGSSAPSFGLGSFTATAVESERQAA